MKKHMGYLRKSLFGALLSLALLSSNNPANAQEIEPVKVTRQGPGIVQKNPAYEEEIIENYATTFAIYSTTELSLGDEILKSLNPDTSYDNNFKKSMLYYRANQPDSVIKYSQVKDRFSPLQKMLSFCILGRAYEKKGNLDKAIKCYNKSEDKGNFKKIVGPYDNPFNPGYFLGMAHIKKGGDRNIKKGASILEEEYLNVKNNSRSDDCALLRIVDEIAKAEGELGNEDKMFEWINERYQWINF